MAQPANPEAAAPTSPPSPSSQTAYAMKDTYFLGLDLGQKSDYTALTVLQRITRLEAYGEEAMELRKARGLRYGRYGRPGTVLHPDRPVVEAYHIRHLERMPLGTAYTAVAEHVKRVQDTPPLRSAETHVVADVTGVGLPVFEMLQAAGVGGLRGVSIHGGDAVTRDGLVYRVPKRDLVSTLQVLSQQEMLHAAEGLPDWPVLRHELQSFQAKINLATGHDTYEAWREGDHDDLVLSLAMACWYAEQTPPARPYTLARK